VIFHSGDTMEGYVDVPKLKYSHPLHIDEVAVDFPKMSIVIAHLGNPWLVDSAEILYKNKNVYADVSGLIFEDDITGPYGKLLRNRVRELLDYADLEDKLIYGTDWPLCPMGPYLDFVRNLGLSEKGLDKLLYGNALKVFDLK
jgi:uncharacterized protein